MEEQEVKQMLLALLPGFRMSKAQRDRLWRSICAGLNRQANAQEQPEKPLYIIKTEVTGDGKDSQRQ